MHRLLSIALLIVVLTLPSAAQETDSVTATSKPEQPHKSSLFYGATIGVGFGSTFRLAFQPFVGLAFTPKLSGGVKVGYEYVRQSSYGSTVTWNNYGASVFGRYRFIPKAYFHAEFAYYSYGYKASQYTSERSWVPFLLLGGGYIQPVSSVGSMFVEVLFDVLQDSKSPYEAWTPWISVGFAVGL